MTMDDAKTLRINEQVIWAEADDRGSRHDVRSRVLKVTDKRVCIATVDNAVHTVGPRWIRRKATKERPCQSRFVPSGISARQSLLPQN